MSKWCKNCGASAKRAEHREKNVEAEQRMLSELEDARNLLSIIHRDGGHHTAQVGFKQSCLDARQIYYDMNAKLEALLRHPSPTLIQDQIDWWLKEAWEEEQRKSEQPPRTEPTHPHEIIRLKEYPKNGTPRVFVTIHEGAGGWNSSVWAWCDMTEEDPDFRMVDGSLGFYEPLNSGLTNTSLGTGKREDAIDEAMDWARDEELPIWIPEE